MRLRLDTAVTAAARFISTELSGGPVASSALFQSAIAAGHSERTTRRAGRLIGVRVYKEHSPHGAWMWSLPTMPSNDTDESTEEGCQDSPPVQVSPTPRAGTWVPVVVGRATY